jgi:hypothetical protein
MTTEPPPTRLRFRVTNRHSSRLDWIGTAITTYTRGELEGRALDTAERAEWVVLVFASGEEIAFHRTEVEQVYA